MTEMKYFRVDDPESLLSPRDECDAFPIWTPKQAKERPYEYIDALRTAQGGKCSCGKCERSEPRTRLNAEARAVFGDVTLEQVLVDARRELQEGKYITEPK